MGKSSGSGGGQNTVVNNSQPPQQFLDAYSALINRAGQVAGQPLQQYTGNIVAPFSDAQNTSFGITGNAANALATFGNPAQQYIDAAAGSYGAATQPLWDNVQQFSPSAVQQYQSPYTQDVVNATQAQFNQSNQIQQDQLTGNAINQGAFGGDRAAVASAVLSGQQELNQAPVIAGLYDKGYGQALQEFNQQQTAELGADQANSWLNSQAAAGLSGLGTQQFNTNLGGINAALQGAGALQGIGGIQQAQEQQLLNVPYQQFIQQQAYPWQSTGWLANITSGLGGSAGGSSATQYPSPSSLSQVLGGAGALTGILGQTGAFGQDGYLSGMFSGSGADAYNSTGMTADNAGFLPWQRGGRLASGGIVVPFPQRRAHGGIVAHNDDYPDEPMRATGTLGRFDVGGITGALSPSELRAFYDARSPTLAPPGGGITSFLPTPSSGGSPQQGIISSPGYGPTTQGTGANSPGGQIVNTPLGAQFLLQSLGMSPAQIASLTPAQISNLNAALSENSGADSGGGGNAGGAAGAGGQGSGNSGTANGGNSAAAADTSAGVTNDWATALANAIGFALGPMGTVAAVGMNAVNNVNAPSTSLAAAIANALGFGPADPANAFPGFDPGAFSGAPTSPGDPDGPNGPGPDAPAPGPGPGEADPGDAPSGSDAEGNEAGGSGGDGGTGSGDGGGDGGEKRGGLVHRKRAAGGIIGYDDGGDVDETQQSILRRVPDPRLYLGDPQFSSKLVRDAIAARGPQDDEAPFLSYRHPVRGGAVPQRRAPTFSMPEDTQPPDLGSPEQQYTAAPDDEPTADYDWPPPALPARGQGIVPQSAQPSAAPLAQPAPPQGGIVAPQRYINSYRPRDASGRSDDARKRALWSALTEAGATTLAGTSPNAGVNIGRGLQAANRALSGANTEADRMAEREDEHRDTGAYHKATLDVQAQRFSDAAEEAKARLQATTKHYADTAEHQAATLAEHTRANKAREAKGYWEPVRALTNEDGSPKTDANGTPLGVWIDRQTGKTEERPLSDPAVRGKGGATAQLAAQLVAQGAAEDTAEALRIIRDPTGKNAQTLSTAQERLALTAAKADPEYQSDPKVTIDRWRKYYGLDGATSGPKVGSIIKGYKFLGGNPAEQDSWEKQ